MESITQPRAASPVRETYKTWTPENQNERVEFITNPEAIAEYWDGRIKEATAAHEQ